MRHLLLFVIVSGFSLSSFALDFTYKAYNRLCVTPLSQEAPDTGVDFGGAYNLSHITVNTQFWSVQVQTKFKLLQANSKKDAGSGETLEKANVVLHIPLFPCFNVAGGVGFSLSADGSFFPIIEEYACGGRWGKTGLAFFYKDSSLLLGLCSPLDSASSSYKYSERGFRMNAGACYNAGCFSISAIVDYDAAGNRTVTKTPYDNLYDSSTKDWSEAVFFKLKLTQEILKEVFSIGGSWNTIPINAIPMSSTSTIAKHNDIPLYHSVNKMSAFSFWSLMSTLLLSYGKDFVQLEGEYAISHEKDSEQGNMISIYTRGQLGLQVSRHILLKPDIMWYKVGFSSCDKECRDCLQLYPRAIYSVGKHEFSFGATFSHIEVEDSLYRWGFTIPIWWKYKFS